MRLRVADPAVRVLSLALAVALVTTPAAGVAGGGTAPPDDHVVPTRGALAPGEDCVIAGDGAGYPEKVSVDCTPTGENVSVVLETSGGWGYVVSLNASSPVRVPMSDFQAIDGGTSADPGDVTNTSLSPGETAFVGPITANNELTNVLEREWLSHLPPAGDEPRIVTQTGVTALPGDPGEAEARYYRSRPSQLRLDLDPGVYRARVVVYETTPPLSLENGGGDNDYQMSRALSKAPRTVGTVKFRVGTKCERHLESEETSLGDITQQRERSADATGLSKGSGDAGLSSVESIGQLAGTGPSDVMTDGLPDLSDAGPQLVTPLDVARRQQAASEAFQNVEDPPDLINPDGPDGEYGDNVRVSKEQPEHLTSEEATDVTVEALANRGIEPPSGSGLTLEDYVRTDKRIMGIDSTWDGDHFDITQELEWVALVRLGPNGNILPKHAELPEVGPCESGTLQKSTSFLKIKFHHSDPGEWDVVVQRIEVATGRLLESNYAGWDDFDPDLEPVAESAVGEVEWLGEATDGTVPETEGDD